MDAPGTAASSGLRTFESDLGFVFEILGQVNGGHPALTERLLDPVTAGERPAQPFDNRRHRGNAASRSPLRTGPRAPIGGSPPATGIWGRPSGLSAPHA